MTHYAVRETIAELDLFMAKRENHQTFIGRYPFVTVETEECSFRCPDNKEAPEMHTKAKPMPVEDLRQMQMIHLEMLLEVDRICRKRGIKYAIIGGTLLGAVRHKGFIPWDDDLDVAMLRSEYDRFCKACEEDLDTARFFLQTHENTPGYRWGYGKLRRVGTEFVREGQEHMDYPTGVWIDIFPKDSVPDSPLLRPLHNLACFAIRKILWSAVGRKNDPNAFVRLVYEALYRIPKKTVFSFYTWLVSHFDAKNTEAVRILTFPVPGHGSRGYFSRAWFEELIELEFERFRFPAPKDYHEYLTFCFGNYLELPPEEERKIHPCSSCKLIGIAREDLRQEPGGGWEQ